MSASFRTIASCYDAPWPSAPSQGGTPHQELQCLTCLSMTRVGKGQAETVRGGKGPPCHSFCWTDCGNVRRPEEQYQNEMNLLCARSRKATESPRRTPNTQAPQVPTGGDYLCPSMLAGVCQLNSLCQPTT
jgi:hypothetical protein